MSRAKQAVVTEEAPEFLSPRVRLLLLSFLTLFLELALIRWAGAEVVHLSYFTNFVLLGSFLGIGLGFLRAGSGRDLLRWAPLGLASLIIVVQLAATRIPDEGVQLFYFGGSPGETGLPPWVVLPLIFLAVAGVMMLVGQGLARAFSRFEPLEAYRLDILGSLLGIAVFAGLSFLGAPPIGWGIVVVALCMVLTYPRIWVPLAGCTIILLILALQSFTPDTTYSPYYKIAQRDAGNGVTVLTVNAAPYQVLERVAQLLTPGYFAPYEGIDAPKDVLIIGAGSGVDASVALSEDAAHIDAVEIDPGLVELGRALHPDRPYQDPRVDVYIDDGRAFLERRDTKYDLIIYSLPDSLTLVTGQAGLRLESYLFTREAVQTAKEHLKPGGTFALFGYFPAPWMRDRMAGLIKEVFAQEPCLPGAEPAFGDGGANPHPSWLTVIIAGPAACQEPWIPSGEIIAPPTDDRPFPYLRGIAVPSFYLLALALLLGASLGAVRIAGGPLRALGRYLDLFFMGAAFLLLETKSVVQFALLFGTTWFVNALVFAGVLLVVLAGVAVARRVPIRRPGLLYPVLFASLAVAWLVPPSLLLGMPFVPRFIAAVLLAFTPVFLANLIFAERFRDVETTTTAFGANLLGAMVGGVMEYAALVVGYRALIVVAGLLYLAAYVFARRSRPVADALP